MKISDITEKNNTGLNVCCEGADADVVKNAAENAVENANDLKISENVETNANVDADATDEIFRYATVEKIGRDDDLNKNADDAAAVLIVSTSIFSRRFLIKKFLIFDDVNFFFFMQSFISHSDHADRIFSLIIFSSVFAIVTLILLFIHTSRFFRYLRSFRRKILFICLNFVSMMFVSSKISLNEFHKSVS